MILFFLKGSAKRADVLKHNIRTLLPNYVKKSTLVSICDTRWVERHDAVACHNEVLHAILHTLQAFADSDDINSDKADSLYIREREFDFIMSSLIVEFVARLMLKLSTYLQSKTMNIVDACDEVGDIKNILRSTISDSSRTEFVCRFNKAKEMADAIGIPVQTRNLRSHSTGDDVADYYYHHVFVPYLQSVIDELETRFSSHLRLAAKASSLIPLKIRSFESQDDLRIY